MKKFFTFICGVVLIFSTSQFSLTAQTEPTTQDNSASIDNSYVWKRYTDKTRFSTRTYVSMYSAAHKKNVQVTSFIDNQTYGGIQDWVGIYGMDSTGYGPLPQPYRGHAGIDVTGGRYSPIYAVKAGKVILAGANGPAGNEVRIQDGAYIYRYLHLNSINVTTGQIISAGQQIGAEGGSGYGDPYYYGSHLHFEVQVYGTPIDPYNILQEIAPTTPPASQNIILGRPGAQVVGNLESYNLTSYKITAQGWHATSDLTGQVARYMILMDDTGKELTRKQIPYDSRPDVKNHYPHIHGAESSGFAVEFDVDPSWRGKTVYVISRYASTTGGNGVVSDYQFIASKQKIPHLTNVLIGRPGAQVIGNLEIFNLTSSKITAQGWHATSDLTGQVARYMLLMDTTGKELARKQIPYGARPDVKTHYPSIHGAESSGFTVEFDVDPSWRGKTVYVISRYASTTGGNGVVSDFHFIVPQKQIPLA